MGNGAEFRRYLASIEPQRKEVFGCPYRKPENDHPYIREGAKPVFTTSGNPFGQDVRSSFSDLERKFLNLAFVQLGKLAEGENLLNPNDVYPTMAERVIEEYYDQNNTPPTFSRPVAHAYFKLFRDFDKINPSFRPVIQRMIDVDGSAGFTIIHSHTKSYLYGVLTGIFSLSEAVSSSLSRTAFVATYPNYSSSYQVWCPGEALSRIVIPEIRKAAEELAKNPKVRTTYDVSNGISSILDDQILDLFSTLYQIPRRTKPND